ncbi:protein kinase domain-containing protein [Streptomyces goshikiensis]
MGDQLAGRYRLDARLGQGGMGEVWRGHDLNLERAVAVKVLLEAATNDELVARFRREATIGARLQHPGITVVHDVGRQDGRLFIVMELLTGEDLAAVLGRSPGGLPEAGALDLAAQTAEALAAAHEQAVVHRDLKPGNLFLLPGLRLKICDFGIAHSSDATAGWTVTGRIFGTPAYMAPEQWRGEAVDARCDLYALGCVLYALLSGEPPFGSAEGPYVLMRRHIEDEPDPLPVRPELAALVRALLAKSPADRPESAHTVAKTLRTLLTSTPPEPPEPPQHPDQAERDERDERDERAAHAERDQQAAHAEQRERDERGGRGGRPEPGGQAEHAEEGGSGGGGGGAAVGGGTEFLRGLLLEAVAELGSGSPGTGDMRRLVEALALAADAAARFDAGLAERLLADAELAAWTTAPGGHTAARSLTRLALRTAPHSPARTERLLTTAQQALFTVPRSDRASHVASVAEPLAEVAPGRAAVLALRYLGHGPGFSWYPDAHVWARVVEGAARTGPAHLDADLERISIRHAGPGTEQAAELAAATAAARHDPEPALRLIEGMPRTAERIEALCRVAYALGAAGHSGALFIERAEQEVALLAREHPPQSFLDKETPAHEVTRAMASLERARDVGRAMDPATARGRAAAARESRYADLRAVELAGIAQACVRDRPWLAEVAAGPGTPPPRERATVAEARPRTGERPEAAPDGIRWRAEASPAREPGSLYSAGECVVWSGRDEVGSVWAATGADRWSAYTDEGVPARPLPGALHTIPPSVRCAADADSVVVAVEAGHGAGVRLLAREPEDGRVRWWRDLPEATAGRAPALTLTGGLALYGARGELIALDRATGETAWRYPVTGRGARGPTVSGDCLVLTDGLLLTALRPADGKPLWSWPRNQYPPGPARLPGGPVHVRDGDTVRALDRRDGRELWRFEAGSPAQRLLVEDGVVYAAVFRPEQGCDLVYALHAESGGVLWEQQVSRRGGPSCALEPLGIRRGVLYVRSSDGRRGGLLGLTRRPPFLMGLDLTTGRPVWEWEHSDLRGAVALSGDNIALALPELAAVALP